MVSEPTIKEVRWPVATPMNAASAVITDPAVYLVAIGVLLTWVIILTVAMVSRCGQPWRDDGRPVFKKLPNGRIQFSWGVAQGLAQAERRYRSQADGPPADPRSSSMTR